MFNQSFLKYMLFGFFLFSFHAHADRIRDLITIQGIRYNQLIGYGLVVGLDGTGDRTNQISYTTHALKNMLFQLGITFPNEQNAKFKNIAAVMVTTKFPNFTHIGQQVDVIVSSVGDATSLQGGTLLMTPLRGTDNKIYAVAQGNIIINDKNSVERFKNILVNNHLNNGMIINGATIEREMHTDFGKNETLNLQLNNEDFTVAQEISKKINMQYPKSAVALNSKIIQVCIPNNNIEQVEMLATIQNINIPIPIQDAKILINAKTGNIITNQTININTCAITHKNISMTIAFNKLKINRLVPNPIIKSDKNNNKTLNDEQIYKNNYNTNNFQYLEKTSNLNTIICALNLFDITTTELISILQSMHDAGCFHAKLEIT
ncbi:flagellar P-ring protein precursor [Buchnera aphidicola str. Bp (Baizongia pistaciae)]|uniref:Flagellar P-ring protein n=1 Tax=Buchnera aphidicola subsp. Baizongia pistaciae (strain Bp) TaxID=224915 RepID=FLGI_BUCBP|nr:flagellar basal body P-ring protein FlgI [Buchnera aphidicola]Q89AH5.1 RecName: Full=Flagellar P-ring protein; AltName: Full=Basal body P-ring protein; Flags: Precursor [Buchnera aphidicola str. Bp (Baizongia pistaciae)]AAO27037.1 flagellar P-ring protein precursor [Buchnera aphidicola str. Bp (Baizongia pistaciae)]